MAINLLPPIQKKEIKDEKTRQKIVFIFSLVSVDVLLFMVMVFLLNFYILNKLDGLTNSINEKEALMKSREFQESKNIIDEANQNLFKISNIKEEQISLFVVLERLGQLVPNSIYLETFSFQNSYIEIEDKEKKAKEKVFFGKVRLGGVSKNRETLFSFKKALSQESNYRDLYFDPSSWVMPIDAKFSAEFSYFK